MDDTESAARKAVLEDLLSFRGPLDESRKPLASFPWDCEEELATLDRNQALDLVTRFLSNHLSADDLERWADAIEVRDDIGYDTRDSSLLKEFVFELANPMLTEPLTRESAELWRIKLNERS